MTRPRGRLRVYLGMAPGVGKTYAMLEEAHRRRARDEDVVVGFVETYGRSGSETQLIGLEEVPRRRIEYRGITIDEVATDAIIRRAPAVVLIDELAHTNAPGSSHAKRWQDVEEIRDAGIDVVSTCNVQHLESVADAVESLVGAPVRERLPDEVLRDADEIELVDLSPARLRRRMRRGEVYPPDRTAVALETFFTEPNLTALRDLSLRYVAGQVDADLQDRLSGGGAEGSVSAETPVMVVLDGSDASPRVLERASQLADRFRAPLLALVLAPSGPGGPDPLGTRLDEIAGDASAGGAQVLRRVTDDPAGTIAQVVRDWRITHLVLGQPHRGRFARLRGDPLLDRLLRLAPDLDISLIGPGSRLVEAHPATF